MEVNIQIWRNDVGMERGDQGFSLSEFICDVVVDIESIGRGGCQYSGIDVRYQTDQRLRRQRYCRRCLLRFAITGHIDLRDDYSGITLPGGRCVLGSLV